MFYGRVSLLSLISSQVIRTDVMHPVVGLKMQPVKGCEDDGRHAGLDIRICWEGFGVVTPWDGMPVQDIKAPN